MLMSSPDCIPFQQTIYCSGFPCDDTVAACILLMGLRYPANVQYFGAISLYETIRQRYEECVANISLVGLFLHTSNVLHRNFSDGTIEIVFDRELDVERSYSAAIHHEQAFICACYSFSLLHA